MHLNKDFDGPRDCFLIPNTEVEPAVIGEKMARVEMSFVVLRLAASSSCFLILI